MNQLPSLDARIYRTALYLYPPWFRREFAEEMARDFDEARVEVGADRRSVRGFRARIWADLVKTVLLQWARTGLPGIALVATIIPLVTASVFARFSQSAPLAIAADEPDAEVILLAFLVMVVLLVVVATILLTVLFVQPRLKKRTH